MRRWKGLSFSNLNVARIATAAGTAIAIAYETDVYNVIMDKLVVVSTACETPFERLANFTISDLASSNDCICFIRVVRAILNLLVSL